MSKYPGRRISATPPSVSTSAASGVWTLEEVAQYRQAGTWPAGAAGADPNFNQTVLLLHGDGNQGANNLYNPGPPRYLAFTDNSDNNFPITVNGDAYGDNFSPFMTEAGQWSNYMTGTTQWLSIANTTALDLPGDFTIEAWVFCDSTANRSHQIIGKWDGSTYAWLIGVNPSTGVFFLAYGNSGSYAGDVGFGTVFAPNQWVHLAVTRSGSTVRGFVNGVQQGTNQTITSNFSGTATTYIGRDDTTTRNFSGYISNVRVVKGRAVYTSNFTPSTTPLGATSGGQNPPQGTETSLLTCQSNRFVDNSSSPKTITINGGVTVKPLNPFTTTYSSTNGSGYFDGTGDNLRAPSNSAFNLGSSSDFTVELWVYPLSFSSSRGLWGTGGTSTGSFPGTITTSGGFEAWVYGESPKTPTIPVRLNSWNHLAVTRSGSTWRIFVNGALDYSFTPSVNNITTSDLIIGNNYISGADLPFLGYISDFRWVKGRAVYTSAFTPPTAPLGVTSGGTNPPQGTETSLLTCQYQGSVRNVGFIDSSPYDHVITRNPLTGPNAPTQGTFSPFSAEPGKWGNYFDGTGDSLSCAANAAFNLGTGNFTFECWLYISALPSVVAGIFDTGTSVNANRFSVVLYSTGKIYLDSNANLLISNSSLAANQWYHIALTREGTGTNQTKLYINGVEDKTATVSTNFSNQNCKIGETVDNLSFNGYISNARIVKGTAVYTSNFTPSTTPLTAISGTSLLTCQSNRFVDNSSNAFAITRNGDVRVTPFSPFAPSAVYDPAVNGGSGYFDGTGDYLTAADNAAFDLGTSNFTIEGWVYLTATSGSQQSLCAKGTGADNQASYHIALDGSTWKYYLSGNGSTWSIASGVSMGASAGLNTWQHIALVRNGNTFTPYVNGVAGTTTTSSTALFDSNKVFSIGSDDPGGQRLTGYISGLRVVKGTALSVSVPTAPLTTITNTSLLLNFTNAGIFDQTGKNVLETVGNAQIDTSVKKFGTGSIKFDGTGDWLQAPITDAADIGNADFTIEAWIYPTVTTGPDSGLVRTIVSTYTNGYIFYIRPADGRLQLDKYGVGTPVTGATAIAANTWTHVAVTRSGNTFRIFINGTQDASNTVATTFSNTSPLRIGDSGNGTQTFYGYIDDLRITKGVARYTANFTPPTAPFLDQ